MKRAISILLCVLLLLPVVSGVAYAETYWTPEPTGWTSADQVNYVTVSSGGKTYVVNWGVRGERAVFLTTYAQAFYPEGWYDTMTASAGGTNEGDVKTSPLYSALAGFLSGKQTSTTSYDGTKTLYKYTDCMVSDYSHISSFYSGIKLNGEWDSGSTWNREHTWPNSKCSGSMENDIMMLRPTSVSENSSRGNTAYGQSTGYYHPNIEAGNRFDLRGDCARIVLYCFVRWSGCYTDVWGQNGVIESAEVLLDWMAADPVDTWEMGRNDAVQSITGVRNCFVDYPELAWALFGQEVPAAAYPTPSDDGAGSGQPEPPEEPFLFEDVANESLYYYVPVYWAYNHTPQITSGTDATHFSPKQCCTREQVVTFLWKAAGAPEPDCWDNPFDDLNSAKYYYTPVIWAVERNITSGVQANRFGVGERCTRAQVVTFLWANAGCPAPQSTEIPFRDVHSGNYYFQAVCWAVEQGITAGTSPTTFSPNRVCQRCEVVTFLYNAMGPRDE